MTYPNGAIVTFGSAPYGVLAPADPSNDDILPSKPRASMRLRPNFHLPQVQLPGLKMPKIRLR